ncbi:MAG: helix-turn-helix transcriptional regulator [Oscillospiraceae bacterium]|nr:helix-turn-helix transcriptional regulator [Oscillospiraceae bacterium]
MEINNKEIGKRIMRVRKEHGYTQEELSELIGFSKNHLSGIECGKYTATTSFLFKLCSVLGRTPDYYLIGQVSSSTDELTDTIRRLTDEDQQLVLQMIKLYLESHS